MHAQVAPFTWPRRLREIYQIDFGDWSTTKASECAELLLREIVCNAPSKMVALIWKPKHNVVCFAPASVRTKIQQRGHAAIAWFTFEHSYSYVSFWPGDKPQQGAMGAFHTFESDLNQMGCLPDCIVRLPNMGEESFRLWGEGVSSKNAGKRLDLFFLELPGMTGRSTAFDSEASGKDGYVAAWVRARSSDPKGWPFVSSTENSASIVEKCLRAAFRRKGHYAWSRDVLIEWLPQAWSDCCRNPSISTGLKALASPIVISLTLLGDSILEAKGLITWARTQYRNIPITPEDLCNRAFTRGFMLSITADLLCHRAAATGKRRPIALGGIRIPYERTKGQVIAIQERKSLSTAALRGLMCRRVQGQEHAVEAVLPFVELAMVSDNRKGKPVGAAMFVGPTGVGKTELARCVAEVTGRKLIMHNMENYQHGADTWRFLGATRGHVDSHIPGIFTQTVKENPTAVVLLDEVEKAHPNVIKALLGVLDSGSIKDNQGKDVSFSKTLFIMTSNLAAAEIAHQDWSDVGQALITSKAMVLEAIHRQMSPEFAGRVSEIVPFRLLSPSMLESILSAYRSKYRDLCLAQFNVTVYVDDSVCQWYVQTAENFALGARPVVNKMTRTLDRFIVTTMRENKIAADDTIYISSDEKGELSFVKKRRL